MALASVGILGTIGGIIRLLRPTEKFTRKHATAALGVGLLLGAIGQSFHQSSHEKLLEAARQGDSDTVRRLLAAGADVNWQDARGDTALSSVLNPSWPAGEGPPPFLKGHRDVVRRLLAAGADANWQTGSGFTVLRAAAGGCVPNFPHSEILQLLLAAGADVNRQDSNGFTALMDVAVSSCARDFPRSEILQLLLVAGADVNWQDSLDGRTALMIAAGGGNCSGDVVRHLLAAGADVNRQDSDGFTAFRQARLSRSCPEGEKRLILLLLQEAGARR